MDGGAWWATVHGVAKSQTQLSNFTHSLTLKVATKIAGGLQSSQTSPEGRPTSELPEPMAEFSFLLAVSYRHQFSFSV